jgi:dolichol-phosphate mannosyltransferase
VRTVFVVPTHNEAENLPALAERLLALDGNIHLVVVNDPSSDGTDEIADHIAADNPRFHVIHRTGKRGYSAACKEGLAWCLAGDFDVVGTIDSDLSHDPARIPALVAAIQSGADLAIGSRYIKGGELLVDWGPARRAVSQAGSTYARLALGVSVRDCTSGFRLYRASMLRTIALEEFQSEGYCFLIEMLAALRERGAEFVEVPISYIDRQAGASKISRSIILEALLRTTNLGFRRVTGRLERTSG